MQKVYKKMKRGILFLLLTQVIIFVYAQERHLGLSREYADDFSANMPSAGYTYTGKAYCKQYFYINDRRNGGQDVNKITVSITNKPSEYTMDTGVVFKYDVLSAWDSAGIGGTAGPGNTLTSSILNKGFIRKSGTPIFPAYYTIGRFSITNNSLITSGILEFYNTATPGDAEDTTMFDGSNHMESYTYSQRSGKVLFVPEPCVHDGPIYTADRNYVYHEQDADGWFDKITYAIRNLFSLNDVTYTQDPNNIYAGRPITLGSNFTNTGNYLPGQISQKRTISDTIKFTIKEPDINNIISFNQDYGFTSGGPTGSTVPTINDLTANYTTRSVSNQWGINPDTIKVYVSGLFTDSTNRTDPGTSCTISFSGSDIDLLSGLGSLSWNNNELGYDVEISASKISEIAGSTCGISNPEYKRESAMNIRWDARDYSNSMKITHNNNLERVGPNQIYGGVPGGANAGQTGYTFNQLSVVPTIQVFADNKLLTEGSSIANARSNFTYDVDVNHDFLDFVGRDEWAGINSGTFLLILTGYESTSNEFNHRGQDITAPTTYVYNTASQTLEAISGNTDRADYSGDTLANILSDTGMHFDIYMEVEDLVGNKKTGFFSYRTTTWPLGPQGGPVNVQAISQEAISGPEYTIINNIDDRGAEANSIDSNYLYETYYPDDKVFIASFDYEGQGSSPITATSLNGGTGPELLTLSGLSFNGTSITGTPVIFSGSEPIGTGLLKTTTFSFDINATNIYGITGTVTYNMTIIPSCAESANCLAAPIMMSYGPTLADAQTMMVSSGIRYNYWFVELINTSDNFYFSGLNGGYDEVALYCAGTGNNITITQGPASGPGDGTTNYYQTTPSFYSFSGKEMNLTGATVNQFGETGTIYIDYITEDLGDGRPLMTAYAVRPLTGKLEYSDCEFTTGSTLDRFGCPIPDTHNRTGDINWTKLTGDNYFVITGHVYGGWFTGDRQGYLTGGSNITGDQSIFFGTGILSHGGGIRTYVISGQDQNSINTSGVVSFTLLNRTGLQRTLTHEVYWIDNTPPALTTGVTILDPNRAVRLYLTGLNTGQLSNQYVPNLIGDDEYIITAFSGNTEPPLYTEAGYPNTMTASEYINNTGINYYRLDHSIIFGGQWTGYIIYEDRAGNTGAIYINIDQLGNYKEFIITAIPAFRPANQYASSGDFWFWVQSGSQWVQNYNSNINSGTDGKIYINQFGTGSVELVAPFSGETFLVTYKAYGILSIGFTGVYNDDMTGFDFTDTSNTNLMIQDYANNYNTLWYLTNAYMKPGDIVASNSGSYDRMNVSDFELLNNSLTLGYNQDIYRQIYDYDLNDVLNSAEQAIHIQLMLQQGFIGWLNYQDIIPLTGFVQYY